MIPEKRHVIKVLKGVEKGVKEKDSIKLKDLSNQTIHSSSIHQNPECIIIAVIVYSLSKIVERTNYKDYKDYKKFLKSFLGHLSKARENLKKDKEREFREELVEIRKEINKISGNFKKHLKFIFNKASINKASRLYEHGLSMEKTANLLGISSWELAECVGKTGISNVKLNKTVTIKERVGTALNLFSK
jgi:hypothetical protein